VRDPHVEALHYALVTSDRVTFNSPPPVEAEREAFTLRLADRHIAAASREARRRCYDLVPQQTMSPVSPLVD